MDTIMDSFGSEKLFPSANLLDLEDLNGDLFNNVPFSEQMEDFSSVLFSSFFDEGLLAERGPLLALDMDQPPSPDIQAEHSYSFSGDSAPQSPSMSIKMDEDEEFEGMWNFSQDLTAILVKQEPGGHGAEPHPAGPAAPPLTLALPPHRSSPQDQSCRDSGASAVPTIKAEPGENNQFLSVPTDDQLQLPPTPPSSHGSDSDGSQSPHSLPPSSPSRLQARSSAAISTSPLLTAPHKLQGTSGPLMLTEEEKRTLVAEGYPVPNKLPLTKTEEKALKRIRRKIKNKISAQESRRKKKEYVECLEKKVENYNSENTDLWKKVETLESANRSLLQQLQKLQSLVTGKIPRSSKMASTQTSTCLMVVVLCFFLVLGSLVPCLPELSSLSQTVKSTSSPPLSTDLYTTSQVRSRSLLFHDEGSQMEDGPRSLLKMEAEGWEGPGPSHTLHHTHDHDQQPQSSRYHAQAHSDSRDLNGTSGSFHQEDPRFHKRELNPDGAESF